MGACPNFWVYYEVDQETRVQLLDLAGRLWAGWSGIVGALGVRGGVGGGGVDMVCDCEPVTVNPHVWIRNL